MKKILTTITFSMLLLVLFSYSAKSQFSVRAGAGYMFPVAGGLLATESTNSNPTSGVYGTLGQGLAFGADLDYKLCTCFGLELGARYWDGSTIKSTSTGSEFNSTFTDEQDGHLNMITLSLGEFYDFCCDDEKIVPYLGFGVDLAVSGKVKQMETITSTSGGSSTTDIYNSETTGKLRLGGYAEFGAKYHINSMWSIFGELRLDAISVMPNVQTITGYTHDGTDMLSSLPTSFVVTDYMKSIPSSYYSSSSSTSPSEQIANPNPASNFSINLGVVINFGDTDKSTGSKK